MTKAEWLTIALIILVLGSVAWTGIHFQGIINEREKKWQLDSEKPVTVTLSDGKIIRGNNVYYRWGRAFMNTPEGEFSIPEGSVIKK
jgi:hypothetical protein